MTSEEIKLWVAHIMNLAKNHEYTINEYIYNNKTNLFQIAEDCFLQWTRTNELSTEPSVEEMEEYVRTWLGITLVDIDTEDKSICFYNDDEDEEEE